MADAKLFAPDADAWEQVYVPVAQLKKISGPTLSRLCAWQRRVHRAALGAAAGADGKLLARHGPLSRYTTAARPGADHGAGRCAERSPAPLQHHIISSFALAAVLLAVLGIYSIIAFSVASRVQEMAIRMALGSQRSHIMRLVLFSGLKLAAIGCVLGLAGAAAASTVLRSFLFHVSPFDPVVVVLTAITVFALALAASALPARRAASVDPIQALRGE